MLLKLRKNRRAQSTLEYAVLIAVIAAGLVTINKYVKRAYQGRMVSSSDSLGEQWSSGHVKDNTQYTYSESAEKSLPDANGAQKSGGVVYSHSATQGSETGSENEWWPNQMKSGMGLNQ